MACPEYWADPEDYTAFWCVNITCADEESQVKNYLRRASSTINMMIQAQGACSCDFPSTSLDYLRDLSIVLAVVYHKCPCARPKLNQEELQMYLTQASEELRMIRTGEIELCNGETGTDFPALGWAEQTLTDFSTASIWVNNALRNG